MGDGPELSCCAKVIKVFLVIFNIFFLLLALGILAAGIYVLVDPTLSKIKEIGNGQVVNFATSNGINLTYVSKCGIAFCVFGGVMLIIAFLGCFGALRNARCLLGFYSTILLLLLLAEIGIGIFAAVFSVQFMNTLTPLLQTSIKNEYSGDSANKSITSVAWDAVMYNVSSTLSLPSNINCIKFIFFILARMLRSCKLHRL